MNQVIHSFKSNCNPKDRVFVRCGRVYACQYSDGSVKVGMTERDPGDRIRCHDHTMRISGKERVGKYVSDLVDDPRGLELLIIQSLSGRFEQLSREWFKDVSLDQIKSIVDRHGKQPESISVADLERQKEEADRKFSDAFDGKFGRDRSPANGYLFTQCMDFAQCMEQAMRAGSAQDHEDLDYIEREGFADCSQFHLMAAITLYTSPRHEWDEMFAATACNPKALISWVQRVTQHYVTDLEVA